MTYLNLTLSVITLNVNDSNASIKRQWWSKEMKQTVCSTFFTYTNFKNGLKVGQKEDMSYE